MPPPQKKHEGPSCGGDEISLGCYEMDDISIPGCGMPTDPSEFISSWIGSLYPALPPPVVIRDGPPPPPPKRPNKGVPGARNRVPGRDQFSLAFVSRGPLCSAH